MKKSAIKKTALYFAIAAIMTIVIAMALLIYLPAFTAYADGEQQDESVTTKCIKIAPRDLEHNAYAGVSGIAVKDLETDDTMFYVPESYFLTSVEHRRIARADFDYFAFSYAGLDTSKWYIDYDATITVETVTFKADENPFPDVRLTLVENGATIYLDNDTVLTNEYTIKFIGFNETGSEFYVSATQDGVTKFAMVDKSLFVSSNIPYQARTQAEREALLEEIARTPKTGDIVPNTSKTLRIILIVGICVPAVLIVFLLFKPTKDSRKKTLARERNRAELDYDDSRSYRRDDRYDDRDRDYRDRRDDRRDDRYDDRDRYYEDRRDDRRDYDRPRDDRRY